MSDVFDAIAVVRLRAAADDLAWLLDHGYAMTSALKLVGDRHDLDRRQRVALARATCSDALRSRRAATEIAPDALAGRVVEIDGLNLLTTLETAVAGGVILACRDSTYRDVASVHGVHRTGVEAAAASVSLAGEWLAARGVASCRWLLDRPVSNSGRLAALIRDAAARHGWPWEAELVDSPDGELSRSTAVVATADSAILDRAGAWLNLARWILLERVPDARVIDLT